MCFKVTLVCVKCSYLLFCLSSVYDKCIPLYATFYLLKRVQEFKPAQTEALLLWCCDFAHLAPMSVSRMLLCFPPSAVWYSGHCWSSSFVVVVVALKHAFPVSVASVCGLFSSACSPGGQITTGWTCAPAHTEDARSSIWKSVTTVLECAKLTLFMFHVFD